MNKTELEQKLAKQSMKKFSKGKLTVSGLIVCLLLAVAVGCSALGLGGAEEENSYIFGEGGSAEISVQQAEKEASAGEDAFDLAKVPNYTGSPWTIVNNNEPELSTANAKGITEFYSPLDDLGRCGTTIALIGPETLPTEKRKDIGMIKPTGWHTVRYDDLIEDKYLYNRCHLIGHQLAGEDANKNNLITGTRYMNTEGMLPFENEVAEYVHSTGNHVLYRCTPIFVDDELVARGVHMEALSVEDNGEGVKFDVFCYNVQPGISIDYATGESWRDETMLLGITDDGSPAADSTNGSSGSSSGTNNAEGSANASGESASEGSAAETELTYVLNTKSHKFHLPTCDGAQDMNANNKQEFTGTRSELIDEGYSPCQACNP